MKGTVVLRYIGNRQEPEESAVPRTWGEVLFESPSLPEWEEFHAQFRRVIDRELSESFKIPVGRRE